MKPIHFCRCGYSAGDHPRTAQCSEGRQTITVPADATPEQVQAAIQVALGQELQAGRQASQSMETMMSDKFSLANKDHLELFVGLLMFKGAMCPKCNYGTRATSKRWAKCKKCGERVARHSLTELPTSQQEQT